MKPKTMILMVVAIGCGLGASYMTSKLLAERGQQQGEQQVPVLVAKQKIQPWIPIKEPERLFRGEDVQRQRCPQRGRSATSPSSRTSASTRSSTRTSRSPRTTCSAPNRSAWPAT
jgi:hypothetical protein